MKKIILACLLTTCLSVTVQAIAPRYCSVAVSNETGEMIKSAIAEALEANGFNRAKVTAWKGNKSQKSLTIDFSNKVIVPSNHAFHMTLCDMAHAPRCNAIAGLYAGEHREVIAKAHDPETLYTEVIGHGPHSSVKCTTV